MGLMLTLATPASAQGVPASEDDGSIVLLEAALDAIETGDDAGLELLIEQSTSGNVWLPTLGPTAIEERDTELLVLGIELLSADDEDLLEIAAEAADYEYELLQAAQVGGRRAASQLAWSDEEGTAVLEVLDRRGIQIGDDARAVLSAIEDTGELDLLSDEAYERAIADLERDSGPPWLWLGIGGVVVTAALAAAQANARRQRELALTDALTGLANRRRLAKDLDRRSGKSTETAVLMIDVDHFKQFNDTHGHALGDEVLRQVGQALATTFREGDVPYRYGGEEFCVVLANTNDVDACAAGERARAAIAAIELDGGIRVTASVGVAVRPVLPAEGAIEAADEALYAAKQNGRNRVELAAAGTQVSPVAPVSVATAPSVSDQVQTF